MRPEDNPGVRVEDGFITKQEAADMAASAREIVRLYGISHISPEQRAFLAGQMRHIKGIPEVRVIVWSALLSCRLRRTRDRP